MSKSTKTYSEIFTEAATACKTESGYYFKGYNGGNALSMYAFENYNVNAADDTAAFEALLESQQE